MFLISQRNKTAHFSIQGDFLVVGGEGNKLTERCKIEDGQIRCSQQQPGLNYYVYYPELVAVQDDYCTLH